MTHLQSMVVLGIFRFLNIEDIISANFFTAARSHFAATPAEKNTTKTIDLICHLSSIVDSEKRRIYFLVKNIMKGHKFDGNNILIDFWADP